MISFLNDFTPSGLFKRAYCFPPACIFSAACWSSDTPCLHLDTFKPPYLRSTVSLRSSEERQGPLGGNLGLTRAELSSGQPALSIFNGHKYNTVLLDLLFDRG